MNILDYQKAVINGTANRRSSFAKRLHSVQQPEQTGERDSLQVVGRISEIGKFMGGFASRLCCEHWKDLKWSLHLFAYNLEM